MRDITYDLDGLTLAEAAVIMLLEAHSLRGLLYTPDCAEVRVSSSGKGSHGRIWVPEDFPVVKEWWSRLLNDDIKRVAYEFKRRREGWESGTLWDKKAGACGCCEHTCQWYASGWVPAATVVSPTVARFGLLLPLQDGHASFVDPDEEQITTEFWGPRDDRE